MKGTMAAAYFPRSQLGNKGIEPLAFSQSVSALPFELTVPSVGWKQQHSHCQMQQVMQLTRSVHTHSREQFPYLTQIALKVRLGLGALVELWDLHRTNHQYKSSVTQGQY